MKFYDISLSLNEKIAIYPGDPEVNIIQVNHIPQDEWNLSRIDIGVHTGTHLDSPLHIGNDLSNISEINLNRCYGAALVLDMTSIPLGEQITQENLRSIVKKYSHYLMAEYILLLKTINSSFGYQKFREDWVCLSSEAAEYLTDLKIKAIGIDSLSIGDFDTHKKLLQSGILVYEGLTFRDVPPGEYTFAGFPIKLETEGSFVRAVLIQNN